MIWRRSRKQGLNKSELDYTKKNIEEMAELGVEEYLKVKQEKKNKEEFGHRISLDYTYAGINGISGEIGAVTLFISL